ncbi:hypothetical protein J6590_037614, partial [Homalodisca vitripennis]
AIRVVMTEDALDKSGEQYLSEISRVIGARQCAVSAAQCNIHLASYIYGSLYMPHAWPAADRARFSLDTYWDVHL